MVKARFTLSPLPVPEFQRRLDASGVVTLPHPNVPQAMKFLLPLTLLALAALSPAPINDVRRAPKPVPERSQAQLAAEMRFNGTYKPVGRIPKKTQEAGPLRDAPDRRDTGSVAAASSGIVNRDDGTLARATEKVTEESRAWHPPVWLLLALAAGGAFGIVRGLRAWADKALPTPRR